MTSPSLLPEGLRDRLPPEAEALGRVRGAVLLATELNGYARVEPPLAEFETTLLGRLKSSRGTDLLRVIDPISQRTLALRPDITAQVGRIAATRMAHHPRPVRLSYGGPVLKLRASELSPERERRQVGCELIGLDGIAAAREVVRIAVEALTAAGISGISIDFTLPDLVDVLADGPMPVAPDDIYRLRDRLDAKDAGGVAEIAPAYLPLIEAAGPFEDAMVTLRGFDASGVLATRLAALAAVAEGLDVGLTLDPTERHGFEYQSWLGFSIFASGVRGEIGRGGTYAIVHNGGEEPAVGFSLYIDPIIDAGVGVGERRRLFVPFDTDPAEAALMRRHGWVTVAALDESDTAAAQLCTHVLAEGVAKQLD